MEADIGDRTQAEGAVAAVAAQAGRLDILINNAGLMLLGPVVDADVDEWDRMISVNVQGLLYTTRAALPHLLQAAENGPRQVADVVNISSVAGRVASDGFGVYNLTNGIRWSSPPSSDWCRMPEAGPASPTALRPTSVPQSRAP